LSDPGLTSASKGYSCSAQVGSVTIAPYLQRTNIVLQRSANELIPALQHRWSEPLHAGVSRVLSSGLGGRSDAPYRVNVSVDHLHGNTDGSVVLQAQWSWSGTTAGITAGLDTQTATAGSFSATLPQPRAGYDALVSTQRQLVLTLCADIRAALPRCD
jgi:uncharacterized lipoprotein YmbA